MLNYTPYLQFNDIYNTASNVYDAYDYIAIDVDKFYGVNSFF